MYCTDDELAVLKAEFGHHAEKLEEYEQMRTEMNLLEGMIIFTEQFNRFHNLSFFKNNNR